MSESRSSAKKIKAAERHLQCLRLRKQGLSYPQIGERMGISRTRAREIVDQELDKLKGEVEEVARDLKTEMLDQLEELRLAVWLDATGYNGTTDLNAVDKALKVLAQKARLLGLDAPAKVQAVGSTVDGLSEAELREEARRHGIPVCQDVPATATS